MKPTDLEHLISQLFNNHLIFLASYSPWNQIMTSKKNCDNCWNLLCFSRIYFVYSMLRLLKKKDCSILSIIYFSDVKFSLCEMAKLEFLYNYHIRIQNILQGRKNTSIILLKTFNAILCTTNFIAKKYYDRDVLYHTLFICLMERKICLFAWNF